MIQRFGGICYLALEHNKSDNPDSFECKFQMKQYTKDNKPKEDIYIRRCNFDIDSRGGLRLFLLNNQMGDYLISLQMIIDNDIKYTLMSGVKEFIPIFAYKELRTRPNMKYQEENNVYLGADFFHSSSIESPLYMVLYNKYLKYKDKYAIFDGVVEKIKFSHFEKEDYTQCPPKTIKYKTYDEIPEEYKNCSSLNDIYEIVQE